MERARHRPIVNLGQLPVDVVRVDRSFVTGLEVFEADAVSVRARF
jgi:sensor c-di-GMP phosphodiesterase-like protein